MLYKAGIPEEFQTLCDLFTLSGLGSGFAEVSRRITIPLSLRQLITFYEGGVLCGFVTYAFLSDEAEKHMPINGIFPDDWRSGNNFWVVDFAVKDGFDGYKMLRMVTKGLGVKRAKYFRNKFKSVREVRSAA